MNIEKIGKMTYHDYDNQLLTKRVTNSMVEYSAFNR